MIRLQHKLLILTTLCALLFPYTANANESKPRLAVVITVDGLQNNILSTLIEDFEAGGFKLLQSKGTYSYSATSLTNNTGKTAHYASLMGGTTPSYHGIIADQFFSVLDKEVIDALTDNRYAGINTKETISPKNLLCTTIADEIKLQNENSKVYAISIDPNSAIMLGGHIADASLWIDDNTGMIATSHYYENGIPSWAAKFNNENVVGNKSLLPWTASKALTAYNTPIQTPHTLFGEKTTFLQTQPEANTYERTTNLKKTPHINVIIKDLAIRALRDENLGTDNATDLLSIEFNVKTPFDGMPLCAEIEDKYQRLDENIKHLLSAIDISVGLDNVVVILTGYNSETYSPKLLSSKRISSGTFNASRAMALLNSYLMAIYGQGNWVVGYYARNIHLNRSLIEENNIKMREIQDYTAQFMLEFSGVHSAISSHQLEYISPSGNDNISKTKLSHYKNRSGDVIINLLPGWYEVDNDNNFVGLTSRKQSKFPAFIVGYEIKNENTIFNIEDIAPTLSYILNLPEPNACTGKIIKEISKN